MADNMHDAVEIEPKRKLHQDLAHVISAEITIAETTISICDNHLHSPRQPSPFARATYSSAKSRVNKVIFELQTDNLKVFLEKAFSAEAKNVGLVEIEGEVKAIVTYPFDYYWIISSPGNTEDPEDLIIDCIRDLVMEKLLHFRKYSSLVTQHAIHGYRCLGRRTILCLPPINIFVGLLKMIAYYMSRWIKKLIEHDEEAEAFEEEDEEEDEDHFNNNIRLAKRYRRNIKSTVRDMRRLLPYLDTYEKLSGLNGLLDNMTEYIAEIDYHQQQLEREEHKIAKYLREEIAEYLRGNKAYDC